MTEGEPKTRRMTEFFSRLMHPEGKPKIDAAKKESAEHIAEIQKRKKEAKEFADKHRKIGRHVASDIDLKTSSPYRLEESSLQMEKAKLESTLRVAKNKPTWLVAGVNDIQHSPEAAAFVSRIASLPVELQQDANVLYQESAYLSASMKADMTPEARQEMNSMLKRTMERITTLRVMHPEDGFSLKNKEIQQTLLFEIGSGSVAASPELYDAAVDLPIQPNEKTTRENLRHFLKSEQSKLETVHQLHASDSERELRVLRKMEEELLEGCEDHFDAKTRKKIDKLYEKAEAQEFLKRIQVRERLLDDDLTTLRNAEYNQRNKDRGFSTLYLTYELMEAMWKDLDWEIEKRLRRGEADSPFFPNTPIAKASEHQLQQMAGYFADHQYMDDMVEYVRVNNPNLTEVEIHELVRAKEASITRMSEEVQLRLTAQIAWSQARLSGDPRKVGETLQQFGVHGVEHMMQGNGGANEMVANRLVQLTREARYDKKSHKLRAYTAQSLNEVREQMKREMQSNSLYKEVYKTRWVDQEFDEEAIDSVIHQAEMALTLEQRDLVAMLEAPGPGRRGAEFGEELKSSSFQSPSTSEKYLGAMDVGRYMWEKWNKLTDAQSKIWRNMCEFAAKSSGRDKSVVDMRLDGIRRGSAEWNELAEEAFGSLHNMQKIVKMERDSENFFSKGGLAGWASRKLPESWKGIRKASSVILQNEPQDWGELSYEDLKNQMVVMEGQKIVGEILEAYDNFSSGWRIVEYRKQLQRMYGDQKLGLGLNLRAEGYGLVHAETKESRKGAEEKVKKVLIDIGQYRPQAIFEWLHEGHDKYATKWFKDEIASGKLTRDVLGSGVKTDILHQHEFQTFVSERFNLINDLLANEGIAPINYSLERTAFTAEQINVLEKVCTATDTNVDAYLTVMKDTSDFARATQKSDSNKSGISNIDKLLGRQYYDIYTRTRWVDDARLRFLEDPDNAPGSKTAAEFHNPGENQGVKHIKMSELFDQYRGAGGTDPFPRAWNDMGVAMDAINFLSAALTVDEKQFFENLVKMYEAVGQYSGKDPTAGRAAVYLATGYAMTAKTDEAVNFFMMNSMDDTSEFKRLLNGEAPSKGKKETLKFVETLELKLVASLESLAPDLAVEAEQAIGIRPKGPLGKILPTEVGRHLPVYADQAKIALALAVLLMLAQAGKVVQEETSGKKKG